MSRTRTEPSPFEAWSIDELRVLQLLQAAGMLPTLQDREAALPIAAAG